MLMLLLQDNKKQKSNTESLSLKCQKQIKCKIEYENKTLDMLQERLTSDKYIDHIANSLKLLKISTRNKVCLL